MAFSKLSATTTSLVAGGAAGVLGVALLTSGGGTFAAWSDSKTVEPGTIRSGSLKIDGALTGTWTDAGVKIPDIAAYKIVPGDTITYTVKIPVKVEGDNLNAKITTNIGDIGDHGLAQYLTSQVAVEGPGTSTTTIVDGDSAADGQLQIEGVGTGTYTVAATITFNDSTENLAGQGESLNLGKLAVTLEQVL
ncbi:MAG: alternate-type signal peptide domain-containing protein [Georgenia sp.]